MHTASPFKYNVTNPQFDLVDPAVKGAFPTLWISNPKLLESAVLTIGCDGCGEETWTILSQKRANQAAKVLQNLKTKPISCSRNHECAGLNPKP